MFSMHAPGEEALTIVPVLVNNESNVTTSVFGPNLQCGVYFFKPNGQSHYVGVEWTTIQVGDDIVRNDDCFGVLGLGIAHDPGPRPRPRLIFLFSEEVSAGPTSQDPFPVPYIMRWNTQTSQYEMDAKPTVWLQNPNGGETIAAVRKQLAAYDSQQKIAVHQ